MGGPLGFIGKQGAIVGVGIDCTREFCHGHLSSVAVKRAFDGLLLCEPVVLQGRVMTPKAKHWRQVHVKFDLEKNTCEVAIAGERRF